MLSNTIIRLAIIMPNLELADEPASEIGKGPYLRLLESRRTGLEMGQRSLPWAIEKLLLLFPEA